MSDDELADDEQDDRLDINNWFGDDEDFYRWREIWVWT